MYPLELKLIPIFHWKKTIFLQAKNRLIMSTSQWSLYSLSEAEYMVATAKWIMSTWCQLIMRSTWPFWSCQWTNIANCSSLFFLEWSSASKNFGRICTSIMTRKSVRNGEDIEWTVELPIKNSELYFTELYYHMHEYPLSTTGSSWRNPARATARATPIAQAQRTFPFLEVHLQNFGKFW